MLYHCSAVIFSSWYGSDGRGRSSGLFNIKNVILCRKNLLLSLEQEVEWGSAHFLLRFFTLRKYRKISESSYQLVTSQKYFSYQTMPVL